MKTKIEFTEGVDLINASGDNPVNILLKDYHTGTLYNGLWLTHMITELNQQLGMTLSLPHLHQVRSIAGLTSQPVNN